MIPNGGLHERLLHYPIRSPSDSPRPRPQEFKAVHTCCKIILLNDDLQYLLLFIVIAIRFRDVIIAHTCF